MLNHREQEWTRKKDKYRERFNAKAQKTQRKSKCRFTTECTEDTEVKT